ncbi:MAG TPA: HAD family acid phosphatase [Rhodanobacter sp.]|nr:HAD family acid phosphatase [Rhodanobacter sp.]
MAFRLPAALFALTLLAGCATPSPRNAPATAPVNTAAPLVGPLANDNLNAVAWTQTAIEHDLIYLQTYRDARSHLLAALRDPQWDALATNDRAAPSHPLAPAVVLDIDETVLDNSPYQARVVRNGGEFNETDWRAWCKEEVARAMPGAVDFTRFAASHGIAVIYISNRDQVLDQATRANLRKVGLPVAGPDALLSLGTAVAGCQQQGSSKHCRRQLISRKYRVLMQIGDQIGDFADVLTNTDEGRRQAMAPYLDWIGKRWFVLPNPTYGSWEPALFHNAYKASPEQRRRLKIEALRYD